MKTIYVNLSDLTELQTDIMAFIENWVHKKKTPVPFREIIIYLEKKEIKKPTAIKAIAGLAKKGYIGRTINSSPSNAAFVQYRRV